MGTNPDLKDWSAQPLRELCVAGYASIQVGVSASSNGEGGGVPYVMPENIVGGKIDHRSTSQTSALRPTEIERFRLKSGDILFSRRGDLNRRALVTHAEDGWLCGSGCLRVRFDPNKIDPNYAYYFFCHPESETWISRHALGATMPHINKFILMSLPFAAPSLNDQRRAAESLSAIDQKIALNESMNLNLNEIAEAEFQLFINGWSPENQKTAPTGWRASVLEDCCMRIANGRTPSRKEARYWNGSVPWLTSTEVRKGVIIGTENSITREGLVESSMKLWPQGTTVIAMVGSTAACTGLLAIESSANQACCGIVSARELQYFVYLYMRTYAGILQRFTKGSAQQNLNQQAIARFPIILPASAVLTAFNLKVGPLFERIINNLLECETLRNLRDLLLPVLFTKAFPTKLKAALQVG